MTPDELLKEYEGIKNQRDDYCDCAHTPRCPHCGKKVWPWLPQPQPYLPPYGEPYRLYYSSGYSGPAVTRYYG